MAGYVKRDTLQLRWRMESVCSTYRRPPTLIRPN